jgi:hypothetical protein
MSCRPPVEAQLVKGIPTAGEDCGVRTTMRTIRWSSCKKVAVTVAEVRRLMKKPTGATNPLDWRNALEHPAMVAKFMAAGLHAPVVKMRGVNPETGIITGSPVATAINALEDGDLICVAEGYGPWHGTEFAGSDTFGTRPLDNHAVSYLGIKGGVGHRRSTRYDSLDDGRFAGIPTGPLTVPWHLAVDAMGALTFKSGRHLGHGLWAGMVVERAKPIAQDHGHQPPPPPPPPDECDCDELRDGLEAARQAIADLRARFKAIDADAQDAFDDAGDALKAIDQLVGDTEESDPHASVVPGAAVDDEP